MKDFIGQELEVGDYFAMAPMYSKTSKKLQLGKITAINDTNIDAVRVFPSKGGSFKKRTMDHIVKIDNRDLIMMLLLSGEKV